MTCDRSGHRSLGEYDIGKSSCVYHITMSIISVVVGVRIMGYGMGMSKSFTGAVWTFVLVGYLGT